MSNQIKLEQIIEDCQSELNASNCSLDDFTKERMEDLLQWYEEKGWFTEKQEAYLRKLWDKI